jgi:hypothetical protein
VVYGSGLENPCPPCRPMPISACRSDISGKNRTPGPPSIPTRTPVSSSSVATIRTELARICGPFPFCLEIRDPSASGSPQRGAALDAWRPCGRCGAGGEPAHVRFPGTCVLISARRRGEIATFWRRYQNVPIGRDAEFDDGGAEDRE